MARINVVTQPFSPTRFTGGIWCVMQYARGLAELGHEVFVVPNSPSEAPQWIDGRYRLILGARSDWEKIVRNRFLERPLQALTSWPSRGKRRRLRYEMIKTASVDYLRRTMPEADATVATTLDTSLQVASCGKGTRFCFMQHFEPMFVDAGRAPYLAEDARSLFEIDLRFIANSSWVRGKIAEASPKAKIELCPNAIDHGIFSGSPKTGPLEGEVKVISYGGRDAAWKGFPEMAAAVGIVRGMVRDLRVRWQVYGDALLPPDNPVAPYEQLGFLNPPELAAAYRGADILLSASWYESFPLFPIEAMACGLPVVTTQYGTEEYAFPGETAEVVKPKDPVAIAEGLRRLIADQDYRQRIAKAGSEISARFTWPNSVARMEQIITGQVG